MAPRQLPATPLPASRGCPVEGCPARGGQAPVRRKRLPQHEDHRHHDRGEALGGSFYERLSSKDGNCCLEVIWSGTAGRRPATGALFPANADAVGAVVGMLAHARYSTGDGGDERVADMLTNPLPRSLAGPPPADAGLRRLLLDKMTSAWQWVEQPGSIRSAWRRDSGGAVPRLLCPALKLRPNRLDVEQLVLIITT